ncbi:MAG TPA: phage holin family protein [Candidatus Thermoplasmatota archaeon]|nr:phage holin family protein [Candidatus Thermoplasmatota archaeon]
MQPERPAGTIEKLAAGVAGAAEGLEEGLEREDLTGSTDRAITQAGLVYDAVREEGQAQFGRGGTAAVAHAGQAAADRVRERVHVARDRAHRMAHEARERAEAVAETAHRAKVAPGAVATDLRQAASAWTKGMLAGIGMYAAAGALALAAFVLLTYALVESINEAIGDPAGGWIVAIAYAAVAGVCIAFARKAQKAGRKEAQGKVEEARQEVRSVTEPLRRVTARRRL